MTAFQSRPWVESFSTREFEVLELVSNGLSNRAIAQKLHLSIETVKWYNKQMFMKLGVNNRIQAVNKAAKLNLLNSNLSMEGKLSDAGNLPAGLTSYVGREKEIEEIKALLKEHRLVVLTGAGGSGKTRLALKMGEELQEAYHDGVWLVELANLNDPSLVIGTIANVLNIKENTSISLDELVKRYLGRRHLLLLIDNLEHLTKCAPLIGDLLAAASGLSVLGTSRERLHIYGEQEYPVLPLELPDLLENKTGEELANVESIALFIKRARAVQPAFSLDEEALRELARICLRLDGLPLAIELCAPMVKVFSLGVISERIEKGLDAIPGGPRDLPARQRTLRDTIQWSYDLLDENERRLFARLSVFSGGGTLWAVETVCGEGMSGNIGNILSELVNKNLVLARERGDGEIHFDLLETMKQFGYDRLLASGETETLADRHAEYFMEFTKQGNVEICGPDQISWTDRIIAAYSNIRTALEWVIESKDTEATLQFVCDQFWFWLRHSDFKEAQRWLERAIALPNANQYKELFVQAVSSLSWVFHLQGEKKAIKMAEQALSLARSQPNQHLKAVALLNFGLMAVAQEGNFDLGQAYMEEAKSICEEINDEWVFARALMHLAYVQSRKENHEKAYSLYNESFNLYKKLGDIHFQGVVKRLIGDLAIEKNILPEGIKAHREALIIAKAVKSDLQIAYNIYDLARAERLKGDHQRAIRLYLASKNILQDVGAIWIEDDVEMLEALETAKATLGEKEYKAAWEAGQKMTVEEAIEFALNDDVAAE
jgi:predicted ATPase/DNA-binding CsgD family transcriptional regulator